MTWVDDPLEITTAATDAVLGGAALLGAWSLRPVRCPLRRRWWTGILICFGLAALLGAVAHGIVLSEGTQGTVWTAILVLLATGAAFQLGASVRERWGPEPSNRVTGLALVASTVFCLLAFTGSLFQGSFAIFQIWVVAALAIAWLVLSLEAVRTGRSGSWLAALGLGVALAGSGVQMARIPVWRLVWSFDHNGTYHLIETAACVLIALAVPRLDRSDSGRVAAGDAAAGDAVAGDALGGSVSSFALIAFLSLLPRNLFSKLAGRLARARLPRPLLRPLCSAFVGAFRPDLSESTLRPADCRSLQELFQRPLRTGVRPLAPEPAFLSPCDGAWGTCGTVRDGLALQLKGRPYAVGELLGSEELAERFEGGSFWTFYLSPRDYHRFHMPTTGPIRIVTAIPGSLWPVNRAGLTRIPGLFAENERLVAECGAAAAAGEGTYVQVAVGATLVGSIELAFDDELRSQQGRQLRRREYGDREVRLERGEEWGRFGFGSTLVLLTPPGLVLPRFAEPSTPLRLGEAIGELMA